MTVSPMRATIPPSTVASTTTLTSTCLPVACDSAAASRCCCASSSGIAAADLGDLVPALGRRLLHERGRRSRRARCARPAPTIAATQRRARRQRLAAHELLDHRHPTRRRQRRVGERHAEVVVALEACARSGTGRPRSSPSCPSARATSSSASAYASMRSARRHGQLPPHLVDVVLDERDLGVAVQVAARRPSRPARSTARRPGPGGRPSPARSRAGCPPAPRAGSRRRPPRPRAIRSLRTCSADWRASSMIRPASLRASASWRW